MLCANGSADRELIPNTTPCQGALATLRRTSRSASGNGFAQWPSNSAMPSDRRVFLRTLGGTTVVGLAGAQLGCPFGATPARGPIDVGTAEQFPVGSLRALDEPVAIGRDEKGLYALSTVCAHRGCDIRKHGEISPQGIKCSCHGSRYDRNGAVTHGPAERGLDHYKVAMKNGRVVVEAGEVVSNDARMNVD
jgi:nitrite reductase/ring-hydroxylating ferredoxin subunit